MSLFVHANNESEAIGLWGDHYHGWNEPNRNMLFVYDVSQTALAPSVMQWDKIPQYRLTAPQL
jgi:hypothetical protein